MPEGLLNNSHVVSSYDGNVIVYIQIKILIVLSSKEHTILIGDYLVVVVGVMTKYDHSIFADVIGPPGL